jgi:hypothetical protein
MSRPYTKRNRRSRRCRQAELAIMQALAAQELAAIAVLDNVIGTLDQTGLDEVVNQAFATTNKKGGEA